VKQHKFTNSTLHSPYVVAELLVILARLVWKCLFTLFGVVLGGFDPIYGVSSGGHIPPIPRLLQFADSTIWPPSCDKVSMIPLKGTSPGHSGSSSVLIMLVSVVVPRETLCENMVWRRRRWTWIFGIFLKYPWHDYRYLQLFDIYGFILWRTSQWY